MKIAVTGESVGVLTFRIKKFGCSFSDVPMQQMQDVNSTYVAGQNQLANSNYVRLQNELAYAQQELNRAEQASPNFANGILLGMAQDKVRKIQSALASTPPYTTQDIVQQYHYQTFEAYRACQVQAVVEKYDATGRNILSQTTVSNIEESRKPGVVGVLAQDKSGARNSQPVLLTVEECETNAWQGFEDKIASTVKDLVAVFLAQLSLDESNSSGDRLAAMLYLSEFSEGTRYAQMAPEIESYIWTTVNSEEREWSSIKLPNLPIPQENVSPGADGANEESGSIERAIRSVVSIETDTGRAGSGFFISPACLVITNEHVISGADTIVLRTSDKKLLSARLLGKDVGRDLALLQTNARTCSSLALEMNAAVGQEVFAIGSPLGLSDTVTRGIISAFRETTSTVHYVQIDAGRIGNSGGPLITSKGGVVGVNTWQFKETQGLNFAVAASEIRLAFPSFLR